jgi:ketosteroid isomerase-like protein
MRPLRAVCAALLAACVPAAGDDPLTPADLAALQVIDSGFSAAWLRDDTTAVLATLDSAAVLVPPGTRPIAGLDSIRAFWWPRDGSHTRILTFDKQRQEIRGTHHLAFIRGVASLTWIYDKAATHLRRSARNTEFTVLTRDRSGRWRILRHVWAPAGPP